MFQSNPKIEHQPAELLKDYSEEVDVQSWQNPGVVHSGFFQSVDDNIDWLK